MVGGTTYTSANNAKLSVLDTENNTAKGGIWETVGTLTFKDASIQVESQTNGSYGTFFTIDTVDDLTIDGGTIFVSAQYTGADAMRIAGDLLIKNGADLTIENRGLFAAINVTGSFAIENSTVKIRNTTNNTAAYMISKMPTLTGVSAKYYNKKVGSAWDTVLAKSGWQKLDLATLAAADVIFTKKRNII